MTYIGIAIYAFACVTVIIGWWIESELKEICKAIKELTNEVNDLKFRMRGGA